MKQIHQYRLAKKFLSDVERCNITYAKLKKILFGEQAIVFIKAVRKHGQPAFTTLKKYHELRYMACTAIQELLKSSPC